MWEELFHQKLPVTLHVDSSACKGMVLRAGTGKDKHLSTKQLWIQGAAETHGINVMRIPRAGNCADIMTHSLPSQSAKPHLKRMGFHMTE